MPIAVTISYVRDSFMKRLTYGQGFTLIEILVVLAIIAILAAIATLFVGKYVERAKVAQAHSDIDAIYVAMILMENDTNEWPGHQELNRINSSGTNEIWDLSSPSAGLVATDGNFPGWDGPYVSSIPLDPWGNPYFLDSDYRINGVNRAALGSFGPNGIGRNVYDDDDVIKILR